MLETLDYILLIGSASTFLYFDLYLFSAYAAHYVYREVNFVCVPKTQTNTVLSLF